MRPLLKRCIVFILEWEARLVLAKYRPRIVAITGSVGKTSTKDAAFAVLSTAFFVRKSEKSFNSEIGVPLTILGQPNAWNNPFRWTRNILEGLGLILLKNHYPKWLVLEVGADRPGDIKRISRWLSPDVVILTRLPDVPVHVEYFDSAEDVAKEKSYLVDALKDDGTLIYNADDERVVALANEFRGKRVSYGMVPGASLLGRDDQLVRESGVVSGMTFRVESGSHSVPARLSGVVGRQCIYTALAALALGESQGVNIVAAAEALASYQPAPGRMRILPGLKGTHIIDDTYNASPIATEEALMALKRISTEGRKIAVLGDMLELGVYTMEEHKRVGTFVADSADLLFAVGIRSRSIAEGALDAGMHESRIFQYEDARRAGKELEHELKPEDVTLIKGSQGMRMERIVEEIMAEPERREELLVRQDPEWLAR